MNSKIFTIFIILFFISCTKEELIDIENIINEPTELVETIEENNEETENDDENKDTPITRNFYNTSFENHEYNDGYYNLHLETLPGNPQVAVGITYIHLNHDNELDLVVKNEQTATINFFISKNGSYEEIYPLQNSSVNFFGTRKIIPADINNDGYMDLILGLAPDDETSDRGVYILKNTNYTFEVVEVFSGERDWIHGISAADINNDGFVDFIAGGKPYVYLGNGDYTFTPHHLPEGVVQPDAAFGGYFFRSGATEMVDINNDGFVDILVGFHNGNDYTGQDYGNSHAIHFGTGDDRFFEPAYILESVSEKTNITHDFSVYDLDEDGDLDIFVNSCYNYGSFTTVYQYYENMGNNTFENKTKEVFDGESYLNPNYQGSDWIKMMDYEKNGKIDLMIEVKNYKVDENRQYQPTDFIGWEFDNGKFIKKLIN